MAAALLPIQDADLLRSASHRNMTAHLTGPFSAGSVDALLRVTAAGRVEITLATREPLIVAAPSAPLDDAALRLDAVLDPDGAATPLPPVEFARYSEQGAFLPVHRPQVNPQTQTATPFTIALALTRIEPDGTETPVLASEIADLLEVRMTGGVLGRLIYILGAEKSRLRRHAREIAAMRLLALAAEDALDRMGADIGVARFQDQIRFDAAQNQIVTEVRQDADGNPVPEPDDEYRRRLAIYRPMLMASRARVIEMLNGPGADGDPNRGLLAGLGLASRFEVIDEDNEFAFAIHIVSSGGNQLRDNFLDYVRKVHLIHFENTPQANTIHAQRFLPRAEKDRVTELRARLRQWFTFPAGAAVAPALARALDTLGRAVNALGLAVQRTIFRAQDSTGGSRYELGLGVDMRPFTVAQLNQMINLLLDPNRQPSDEAEIEALLRSMEPLPVADDPEARWLLEACGLRTIHRINTQRLYLSHLPTSGMAITGPSLGNPEDQLPMEARFHAPGDPGSNAVLVAGLEAALDEWTASGGAAWAVLDDATARARWDQAAPRPAADPAFAIFRAAGLPAIETPAPVVDALKRLPPELIQTISLPAALAQAALAGQAASADELRRLVDILRKHGLASALPLITGPNEVVLAVGVIGLPQAGINLSDRRATGFRWYIVPIQGRGGQIRSVGSRTVFTPRGRGLYALVAIGYARRGLTDPYEFRVDLPDDAMLNLLQYEFLMNLLDHVFPIGVEINTFSIRKQHVDLDGDGNAEALPPTISRTFRKFRRHRLRGEVGVNIEGG